MDYTKLKGRPSIPFETIGVAIAFSPRLENLLGEAKRLSELFGAQLLLMHIGERTRSKEARLDEIFHRLGIDEKKTRVTWHEGEPVANLLELCKLNVVDLLVLGAMQKENVLRYYLGSIARRISRKAKCSVLLLTDAKKEGSRFRKAIVSGVSNPKTKHTINTTLYFAKHVGIKNVIVAMETDQTGLAMTMAGESTEVEATNIRRDFEKDELDKINDIVAGCSEHSGIEITRKAVKGKPGYAIRQYAATKKADLLVINSPDVKYGIIDRIFTHDMEYILEDMPCNVLIIHSRISEK